MKSIFLLYKITILFIVSSLLYACNKEKEIKIESGLFDPSYESLQQYQCPEWFRDAKFGIWAHYGVQCAPEEGDWYARKMYEQYNKNMKPGRIYQSHLEHYGHPSKFGFKDVIPTWKAENWNPDSLVSLYKRAGAKYFVAMANHHDNFDNYDSKYQEWNSVNMGPEKDLIEGWSRAARKNGLRFGVSNHSSHAWHWYQKAYAYDVDGPYKDIRYDGWTAKEDGDGKWWKGYDPQELYGGNHYAPPDGINTKEGMDTWFKSHDKWYETIPENDNGYSLKWFLRCKELVDKYKPDLLYFDDRGLPLEEYGLSIAAHFYNANMNWHEGRLEAVINAKHMDSVTRQAVVMDIERGKNDMLDPLPWQTDDCIGVWHYSKNVKYKTVDYVIKNLVDIVSKNGNLLLSIPLRSDGSLDEYEGQFLENLGKWMSVCGEGIYGTRPWNKYGEGPKTETYTANIAGGEVVETKSRPLDANDIRFTSKENKLYVFALGHPQEDIKISSLGDNGSPSGDIKSIEMLGSTEEIKWRRNDKALVISKPVQWSTEYVVAFRVEF